MKITLDIKDSKVSFFLELLQNFEEFITIENTPEANALTDKHKELLDNRLAALAENSSNLLNWDDVSSKMEQDL